MSAQVCRNCTAAYSIGAPRCPQCGANSPLPVDGGPNGPSVRVRCPGGDCPEYGVERVVPLRLAVPGVVERPQLRCAACDRVLETVQGDGEKGDEGMPKVTVHGGASDATFDDEGGEQSSPTPEGAGTTSSTSSEKAPTSPETSGSGAPSRARTTGSRSGKGRTGSSTARGTAGDQTAPTSDDES